MKTKIVVLPVGPNPSYDVDLELPLEPSYNELMCALLRHFPSGTRLEHVAVFSESREYVSMLVDEEGAIKELPLNPLATIEYQRNVLVNAPGSELAKDMPNIYGYAVLFDRNVWF